MKLTAKQLGDWFFTANPEFPPTAIEQYLNLLETPPIGTRRSEVISGMKQGIGDTLTIAKWWPSEKRETIDASLKAKGLPTILLMEAALRKKHRGMIARAKIRNDVEFHLAKEVVDDLTFPVSDEDRVALQRLMEIYETEKS